MIFANIQWKLIGYVVVGLIVVSVFFYIKWLQSENEVLRQNQIKLEMAIEEQKKTIGKLQEHIQRVSEETQRLNGDLQKAFEGQRKLKTILEKHDLVLLSTRKPGMIEKRINMGTRKIFEELEQLTRKTQP